MSRKIAPARFNPLDYAICFERPRRAKIPTWLPHIPFAMFLVAALKPRALVELGTYYGDSYCAFCQAVQQLDLDTRCFAVDTWQGDEQAGFYGPEVLADLRAHHDPLYSGFSTLVQQPFDEAAAIFPDGSIDLLHLDGLHTYEAVRHDWDTWLPKVSSQGVVLLHDINVYEGDFGVWRLWRDLEERYRSFAFPYGYGLGVVFVGGDPPGGIRPFLEADGREAAAISRFFYALGERSTTERARLLDSWSRESRHDLDALKTQANVLEQRLTDATRHTETVFRNHAEQISGVEQRLGVVFRHTEDVLQAYNEQIAGVDQRLGEAFRHVEQVLREHNEQIAAQGQRLGDVHRLLDRANQNLDEQTTLLAQRLDAVSEDLRDNRLRTSILTRRWRRVIELELDLLDRFRMLGSTVDDQGSRLGRVEASLPRVDRLEKDQARLLGELAGPLEGIRLLIDLQHRLGVPVTISGVSRKVRGLDQWLKGVGRRIRRRPEPASLGGTAPLELSTSGLGGNGTVSTADDSIQRLDAIAAESDRAGAASDVVAFKGSSELSELALYRLHAVLAARQRLIFPAEPSPLVSIVIPTLNGAPRTYLALESILASSGGVPYELIVVDNGSEDESRPLLRQLENVRVSLNDHNAGFGGACNQGASMARGQYVCFLNSDALVSPGWLGALVQTVQGYPGCGAVGAKLVFPSGRLQEAGSIIWQDGSALGYGRGSDPLAPEYCYVREVDFCSAACLLVDKQVFASVGGFDDRYLPAYYEDVDLCFAIRKAGCRVVYQPNASVVHFEHGSSDAGRAVDLQLRNRQLFVGKWYGDLSERWPQGSFQELVARDLRQGSRVLVIDDRVPSPMLGSGFPRTHALLNSLAELGYVVTFLSMLPILPETDQRVCQTLQSKGIEVIHGLTNVLPWIGERADLYDAVLISRPHNARLMSNVRSCNPNAAIVYDAEAIYALRDLRRAEVQGPLVDYASVEATLREEIAVMDAADAVITVSEHERRAIQSRRPDIPVVVWGHPAFARMPETAFDERENLLFVGYLASPPNSDALLFLISEVLPKVRARVQCRLVVAGADPDAKVESAALDAAGAVEFTGFVEDLRPVYDRCRVFVAPHRFAAGIPLKVIDAMANGMPCVVSRLLAQQLEAVDEEHVLVAEGAEEIARQVARLYQDEVLWLRIQASGWRYLREHHDPDALKTRLRRCIDAALTRRVGLDRSADSTENPIGQQERTFGDAPYSSGRYDG